MHIFLALFAAGCSLALVRGDNNSYNSCLNSVKNGQSNKPARDENQPANFQETALRSRTYCKDLYKNDCLFYHEATDKCSCVCEELITNNKERMGNAQNDNNNNPKPYPDNSAECFSGDVTVETNRGPMTLSEISGIRDGEILLKSRNEQTGLLEMSPLIYWSHVNPNIVTKFLDFETASGHKLSITGQHVIYDSDCNGKKRTVLAKRVEIGRCLYVESGNSLTESPVVGKTEIVKKGIYTPITASGNVIVNGISASCYTNGENDKLLAAIFGIAIKLKQILSVVLPECVINSLFGDPFSSTVETPTFMYSFIDLTKLFVRLF